MCVLEINSCGGEGLEAGLGKGRSQVAMQSHWRSHPTPWATLELGWSFRVILSWGKGAEPVHPCTDQALDAATGEGSITLGEAAPLGWANPQRG